MIKRLTYRNFMVIMNRVIRKGYSKEEAESITRGIFDKHEANPNGVSVEALERMIVSKEEYDAEYGKG